MSVSCRKQPRFGSGYNLKLAARAAATCLYTPSGNATLVSSSREFPDKPLIIFIGVGHKFDDLYQLQSHDALIVIHSTKYMVIMQVARVFKFTKLHMVLYVFDSLVCTLLE